MSCNQLTHGSLVFEIEVLGDYMYINRYRRTRRYQDGSVHGRTPEDLNILHFRGRLRVPPSIVDEFNLGHAYASYCVFKTGPGLLYMVNTFSEYRVRDNNP